MSIGGGQATFDPTEVGDIAQGRRDPDLPPLPNKKSEFEWEDYLFRQTVNASDVNGNQFETTKGQFADFEPLQGQLRRNQVAELVGLVHDQAAVYPFRGDDSGTGVDPEANPGHMYAEATLARKPTDSPVEDPGGDVTYFPLTDHLIHKAVATGATAYKDSGAGAGGGMADGMSTANGSPYVWFPALMGSGYFFYDDDEVQISGNVKTNNVTDALRFRAGWRACWAVHTFEEPDQGFPFNLNR